MKPIKNLLFTFILFCTYNVNGQWIEIENINDKFLETINFLDDNIGYVIMNNDARNASTIMKTVDGGAIWTELNLPMHSGAFQDLYFYAEGEGVAVIRNFDAGTPAMIFKTMDDGLNWEDITPDSIVRGSVAQCQFLNQDLGFLVTNRYLYTTTDGGENWTTKKFDDYLISLHFLDAQHGTLGTWNGRFSYKGGMLSTSDGGLNWRKNTLDENYTSILEVRQISPSVAFAAPVHSWAAALAGQFYKTTDAGLNWDIIEIPKPENDYVLRQIDFTDEMNGVICVGDSRMTKVYHTTDGGQNWVEEGTITSAFDMDLQLTPNSGYIGGKIGSFYKQSTLTSTKEESTSTTIKVFPTLVQSGQTIQWHSPEYFTSFVIIDPKGMHVHQQDVNQNQAILPQLNSGLYFIQLRNEKVFATAKLVVE